MRCPPQEGWLLLVVFKGSVVPKKSFFKVCGNLTPLTNQGHALRDTGRGHRTEEGHAPLDEHVADAALEVAPAQTQGPLGAGGAGQPLVTFQQLVIDEQPESEGERAEQGEMCWERLLPAAG